MTALAKDCVEGKVNPDEISEALFDTYLDTHDIPDPDLMIRTSGEQRLSNYLLWQLAYSEFYFTDVPWPDFSKEELVKAVAATAKLSQKDTAEIIGAVIETIEKTVAKKQKVTLVGFGTFEARKRAARTGRNPQTGKEIKIAAKTVPAFSAGKKFKEAVK